MRIAAYTGQKTLHEVAKRLFALPEKSNPSQLRKAEAALLAVNPHLSQLKKVSEGTPILIPAVAGLGSTDHPLLFAYVLGAAGHESAQTASELRAIVEDGANQESAEIESVLSLLKTKSLKNLATTSPAVRTRLAQINENVKARQTQNKKRMAK